MVLVSGKKNQDTSDDWCVEGSDDEKYDSSKSGRGIWEPAGAKILQLFERIDKEKVLELKWKCPGRRPPEAEKEEDPDATQDPDEEMEQEEPVEEIKPQQPTEFDFDDTTEDLKVTPRHTPGSKTPKSQKKVARMDKVLQDIMIQRKQSAAEKEARRMAQGRSPRTPLSGARARMSSPGSSPGTSPMSTNRGSPGATPLRHQFKDGFDMPPIRNLVRGIENPGLSVNPSDADTKQNFSSGSQTFVSNSLQTNEETVLPTTGT